MRNNFSLFSRVLESNLYQSLPILTFNMQQLKTKTKKGPKRFQSLTLLNFNWLLQQLGVFSMVGARDKNV